MARVCVRHPFELSDNFCGHCGLEFCRDCLVYPKGTKKAALCVSCAIAASGVRSSAAKAPSISKRELKRRKQARDAENEMLARHEREPEPIAPITNPFSPGWAVGDEELPETAVTEREPITVAPPPPPPASPSVDPVAAEPVPASAYVATMVPTLADLLPAVPPDAVEDDEERSLAALADLDVSEPEPVEERRPRSIQLPTLRRREPEPADDGSGASEMIAWLDEVFAPRDER